mmetsp:Transcript_10712/g.16417  ORF Transcript_10712/g.16417 Transcript_10712/m.16417 type:complete len:184 (+) Transcript_10712:120-671(+)
MSENNTRQLTRARSERQIYNLISIFSQNPEKLQKWKDFVNCVLHLGDIAYEWSKPLSILLIIASLVSSLAFQERYILSGLSLVIFLVCLRSIWAWGCFYLSDPLLKKGWKFLLTHKELVLAEMKKSNNGGAFRRAQESIAIIVSHKSTMISLDYLKNHSTKINDRMMNQRKELLAKLNSSEKR